MHIKESTEKTNYDVKYIVMILAFDMWSWQNALCTLDTNVQHLNLKIYIHSKKHDIKVTVNISESILAAKFSCSYTMCWYKHLKKLMCWIRHASRRWEATCVNNLPRKGGVFFSYELKDARQFIKGMQYRLNVKCINKKAMVHCTSGNVEAVDIWAMHTASLQKGEVMKALLPCTALSWVNILHE